MGKRGPKSTSELAVVATRQPRQIDKPPMLTERAAELWDELVVSVPNDHFRPGDAPLLRAYCEATALHEVATAMIFTIGAVVETDKGLRKNPWVEVQTAKANEMSMLATKLRLCVNARITAKSAGRKEVPVKSSRDGLMWGGKG